MGEGGGVVPCVADARQAGGVEVLVASANLAAEGSAAAPDAVVAVAPVADLVEGQRQRLSDDGDAIAQYCGGMPEEVPEAYAAASPTARLPNAVPVLVAIGREDVNIPPAMARAYAEAAGAPYLEVAEHDHFSILDTAGDGWPQLYDAMCALCPALRQRQ